MKKLHPDEGLRIFDIKWGVTTAGPSPNNNTRVEVFLLGCEKAMSGNPCKGCFNSITWDKSIAEWSRDPIEVADMINEKSPNNKYITIGGGEPSDQSEHLIPFVKRLKEHGFHIIMYTWRELEDVLKKAYMDVSLITYRVKKSLILQPTIIPSYFREIIKYVDIIIDGEFIQEEKLWDPEDENIARNFIGSGNQIIWDIKNKYGYSLKDLKNISLLEDNTLSFSFNNKDHVKHTFV